jgi:hypothetical protein
VENVAAAIAVVALVFTGVEFAAPGKILRIAEPREWKVLAMALVLCATSAAFGVIGMLRGEGFIVPTVWPPPAAEDATEPSPQTLSQSQPARPKEQPAQQDQQQADPSDQAQQPAADKEYPAISLSDLKLDRKRMIGRKITVSGTYTQVGDMSTLSSGLGDTSPIFMDVSRLPPDQRKALLDCGAGQCEVDVEGVVGPLSLDIGVQALNITIRQ